jgi:hypothetical protein
MTAWTLAISDKRPVVAAASSTSSFEAVSDEFYPLYDGVTVTVPATSATNISSGQAMVTTQQLGSVTLKSAGTLEWESAIQGGMRFSYIWSPGVFLVGYGARTSRPAEEVVQGFYEFAGQGLTPAELNYVNIASDRFPALVGWQKDSGVVVEVEGTTAMHASIQYPVMRNYWPGWQPAPLVEVISEPPRAAHVRGAEEDLSDLFEEAEGKSFEPDEEADFDIRLTEILKQRRDALKTLSELLMESNIPSKETAQRAIHVVASHETIGATSAGIAFLATLLKHPRPSMRDSAALGLYELGVPVAGDLIREALQKESSTLVRRSMAQIIDALERKSR